MRRLLTDRQGAFRRLIVPVAAVALAAAIGNMLSVPMGGGLRLLLGNVLVFAALRFLTRCSGLALAPLAASPLWWFWHDPVLWLVWTAHVALIACIRAASPIVVTAVYCLTAGVAISLAGYILLLGSQTDLAWTAWASSAFNCILNVTLGELLYLGIVQMKPFKSFQRRRAGIEAVLVTVMATALLVPVWSFWMVQLPQLTRYGSEYASDRGKVAHQKAIDQIDWWVQTSTDLLRAKAVTLAAREDWPTSRLTDSRAIRTVALIDQAGAIRAATGTIRSGSWPSAARVATAIPEGQARVVTLNDPQGRSVAPRMIAPIRLRGEKLFAIGEIDEAALNEGIRLPVSYAGRTIVERRTGYNIGNRDQVILAYLARRRDRLADQQGVTETRLRHNPRTKTYFTSADEMTLLFSSAPASLPGWTVLTTERVPWNREASTQILMKLIVGRLLLMVGGIAIAALLARYVSFVLRKQARAVANLAAYGETTENIDHWLIRELGEISTSLAAHDARLAGEQNELVVRHKVLNTVLDKINYVAYSALHFSDGTFRIEFLTENVEKLLGYPAAEALTEEWAKQNVHPDDWEERTSFDLRNRDLKAPREYRLRHKDGHYIWIERRCVHIEFVPEFDAHRVIGVYSDIGHRKQAQDENFRADKLASLGRMASGIAHELNQPLNFIRVSAINLREGLKRGLYPAERAEEKLTALLGQVERAGAIIRHMRRFGQSETVTREPVVLRAVVDQALALAGGQLALESISVDTTRCGRHVIAVASPALLEQVVLNLLLNGRDAVLTRLETEPEPPGRIKIRARRDHDRAVLVIEDNGTGIPDDLMPMLFEPFFTTKAPDKGMGLGLSITFEIIQSMRGEIRASNTGKGARFEIHLPAA